MTIYTETTGGTPVRTDNWLMTYGVCTSRNCPTDIEDIEDSLMALRTEDDRRISLSQLKGDLKKKDAKRIGGAIWSCIEARGPITRELIGSAVKRVLAALYRE